MSELGLEFNVYVFKTLIRLKNFSLFEFMIGALCCNLLVKQPAFFSNGKSCLSIAFIWISITRPRNLRQFLYVTLLL